MKNGMPTKIEILSDLITFSSLHNTLSSNYFYEKYSKDMDKKAFRRTFASMIEEIIQQERSNPKGQIILTLSTGYYIPKTKEEAEPGLTFIFDKAKNIMNRAISVKEMVNRNFNSELELF
jgi:hypothetical protein